MTTQSIERLNVDPATLLVDVNIRNDVRLDKDFVASLKELGVLVPIIAVRTASGDVRVRFGHRRTLGAIEAGLPTVPVDVIGEEGADDAAAIERILSQHAENVHRAGLTAAEEVEVVAQLSAFGVKAGEITKKTRIPKKDVKAAMAVAGSELAKAASERYDFLTLEQAAAVAEFQDDDEAVKKLVVAAREGGFAHVVERLREDREEQKVVAKAEADLLKQGVTVIERPSWNDPAKPLVHIRRTARTLTDQAHESCPGHAAFVEAFFDYDDDESDRGKWITEVNYVCTDPVAYGHLKPRGTAAQANEPVDTSAQDAADEAAREERRRVLANNKAWRSAETVRRTWLRQLLGRKSTPKGSMRFVIAEMADPRSPLAGAMSRRNALACELLGVEPTPAAWMNPVEGEHLLGSLMTAPDARAEVIALAIVLGAQESTLTVDTWRRSDKTQADYLGQLTVWGYELSAIEQMVVDLHAIDDGEGS